VWSVVEVTDDNGKQSEAKSHITDNGIRKEAVRLSREKIADEDSKNK
jgi:hypothetical protein